MKISKIGDLGLDPEIDPLKKIIIFQAFIFWDPVPAVIVQGSGV